MARARLSYAEAVLHASEAGPDGEEIEGDARFNLGGAFMLEGRSVLHVCVAGAVRDCACLDFVRGVVCA